MDMDRLKKSAAALAGAAVRTTRELSDKGRRQMDRLAAERKLAPRAAPAGRACVLAAAHG